VKTDDKTNGSSPPDIGQAFKLETAQELITSRGGEAFAHNVGGHRGA